MSDWKSVQVKPDATIREALAVIDSAALKIALVVDAGGRLLGTVSDGDIRRAMLGGIGLDGPVSACMNRSPLCADPNDEPRKLLALMQARRVHQIPVVDSAGVLRGLETIDGLLALNKRDNPVILMAGGVGSRLRPLTDDCPKPLLHVGDRPILETILCNFIEHGFRRFFIAVNYRADLIQEHFGDGSRWGVSISYLLEREALGTAGALALLPERPQLPVFVMNGDILARINLGAMLDFHQQTGAVATLGVREFTHTIPYGVVSVSEDQVVSIVEKPQEKVFVSAGIYVLSPHALDHIPRNENFDMPTLIQRLIGLGSRTVGFPIKDWWIDIGRIEDFDRARSEYGAMSQ